MNAPINGGRSRAFEALRASEELHRAVLENISDAVFLTDDEGRFTFICPNVDVIFGYLPDEVQAMARISQLLGDNLFDHARLAADGEVRNIEREVTSKSGERRTLLIHAKKVSIQGGTVLCACRDITDLKSAEKKMRVAHADLAHASRLAVVGELIASVVHEITQPLTAVSMNASAGIRLLNNEGLTEQVAMIRDIFTDIRSHSHLAAEIIERLRTLSRKQTFELEVLDANEIVSDLLRLVAGEAQLRGITLESELAPAALLVTADRVCLGQVVLNLVLNAMDAVSQKETERSIRLRTRRLPEAVEISVSDTGPGIPAEDVPRLFDAFFTTKKSGVGLGLTIARSLVEAQNGQISVVGRGEEGTTFLVTLPAHEAVSDAKLERSDFA